MKKIFPVYLAVFVCFAAHAFAQIPVSTLVQISRAEDELRFDKTLEDLMKNPDAQIRARAALAAGRIGKDSAIAALTNLLETDSDANARTSATFSIGEIESIAGADAILRELWKTTDVDETRARAIEAAGKIAAANAKDEKSKQLGKAILDALQRENTTSVSTSERNFVLLGITAILRARPEGGEMIAAKFLSSNVARIRADAANTLSRLRAKNANEKLRAMLSSDNDAIARANAARALGAAEDKDSFDLLLNAAASDKDSRVRVSAIRSLGSLKDAKAADKLLIRGENLLANYKKSKFANPSEKSELLEIATTLSRILPNTNNEKAIAFLDRLTEADLFKSTEIVIARLQISSGKFIKDVNVDFENWREISVFAQAAGELAKMENLDEETKKSRTEIEGLIKGFLIVFLKDDNSKMLTAIPDVMQAYANFKPEDLTEMLHFSLNHRDVFVRATAAELLGEQPPTKENVEALKIAFAASLKTDKFYNDAQLAILSALVKLDKAQSFESLRLALNAPDYLVRRRAADLIKANDLAKDFRTVEEGFLSLKPYDAKTGTKLGQILNTNADYVRAVSRKNARAILTTEKGTFTIEFSPTDAPLTVDNFIKLAKAKYFDGLAIHRVVPNFVMQDGDPRGDGNGSPGWEIRDEINMLPFERGAVGMALSGKNTGGSQWFVCHSPQPHLDGGYTVFGRVNETDMKIVDNLVRGDKILSVKIIEGSLPERSISHEQTRTNTKIKKN